MTDVQNMKFLPMFDYILVEEMDVEEKTDGGLILTSPEPRKGRFGKVVRVGVGPMNKDGSVRSHVVSEGDVVTYSPNAPKRKITSEGNKYILLTEAEIYGVYK